MSLLAAIRPDDWNLPLFLHVLSAMALVGGVVLALAAAAGRQQRLAYRTLLLFVLPSWLVMRLSAQWIAAEQGLDDPDTTAAWIDIGFATSEGSFLLLVAATACAGVATRRARGDAVAAGGPQGGVATRSGLLTAVVVLLGIALAAYLVAIWAMSFKPS